METSVNAQPNRTRRRRWLFRLAMVALLGMGALYLIGRRTPTNLGVNEGRLAACPESPNCVSTQAEREDQRIQPLRMVGDLEAVTTVARQAILEMPRAKFVKQEPDYCHVECTSLICRYVDDFEIWIDEANKRIHARSASRVGYSDMGVNRKRVAGFFDKLVAGGVASPVDSP